MGGERLELVSIKEVKGRLQTPSLRGLELKPTDVIFMQPLSRLDTHRYSRGI